MYIDLYMYVLCSVQQAVSPTEPVTACSIVLTTFTYREQGGGGGDKVPSYLGEKAQCVKRDGERQRDRDEETEC